MAGISNKAAGSLTNKNKYNGKELQLQEFSDGSGLDWYDYGARMYDVQIGRWQCLDPLSEKYQGFSPYTFVYNNPLLFIDPNGMEIKNAWKVEGDAIRKQIEVQSTISKDGKASQDDKDRATETIKTYEKLLKSVDENAARTDEILTDLKNTDNQLYNTIDNLKDKKGNIVDVYVKSDNNQGYDDGQYGKSEIKSSIEDDDKPSSKYDGFSNGRGTVTVTINSRNYGQEDAVVLTAHEFGHLKYNVPNLVSYQKYWKENYREGERFGHGHRRRDPSGKSADEVLKRFLPLYRNYKKNKN